MKNTVPHHLPKGIEKSILIFMELEHFGVLEETVLGV